MAKYVKRPVVIEAERWLSHGDHPDVRRFDHVHSVEEGSQCKICGCPLTDHGWIETLEGGHIVCPGDYIITGVEGERYPCKPRIFHATYEKAREDNSGQTHWEGCEQTHIDCALRKLIELGHDYRRLWEALVLIDDAVRTDDVGDTADYCRYIIGNVEDVLKRRRPPKALLSPSVAQTRFAQPQKDGEG